MVHENPNNVNLAIEEFLGLWWDKERAAKITAKYGPDVCAEVESLYHFAAGYDFDWVNENMDRVADRVESELSQRHPYLSPSSLMQLKNCFYYSYK